MSKNPPKPQPKPRNVKIMRAIFDYSAEEEDELSFLAGDILYILDQSEDDWWKARCKGKEGLIPSNLVESASADGSTSPLHDAAKRGNIDLLKECLVNRLPVNQLDPAGNTPLHWAARTGHSDCLKELLGIQQVQVDKVNKLGDTAIMLATAHGHAEAVNSLLKAGASTKLKNNEKKGVTDLAKDPDVCVVLRKWGVIEVFDNKSIAFGDDDYNDDEEED
eukprot:GFUD01032432.1.p1 GENE.GFUD01032432.1~~GFUD01032432.1.p1  ORF type:complete len:220 (-),score=76.73 GFUD01032432.1:141-800(-)